MDDGVPEEKEEEPMQSQPSTLRRVALLTLLITAIALYAGAVIAVLIYG